MEMLRNASLAALLLLKVYDETDGSTVTTKVSFYRDFLKKIFVAPSKFGQYPDIAKKTRDLLYADYNRGLVLGFRENQVSCSLTKMRRSRPFLGRLSFETSFKSLTMVVDIDTNTSAFVNSRIEAVAPALTPGLSCVVDVNIPDQNSSKIDLHYLLGILSLSTSIGVLNNPIVSVSGVLGNDVWSVGSDLAFNSNILEVTRFNGGFSSTWDGRIVSLTLEEKCRLVKGHYYHPFSNYTIGAEWCFNVARRRSTLSFGAQLHFGGDTDVKARVNKEGVAAVYRHSWSPGSFVRLSVEKRFSQKPLFGVALVLEA